jgi:hypothetical protein
MNTAPDLVQELRAHFDTHADRAVLDGQLEAVVARTASIRQRPAWLAALRSPHVSATPAVARPAVPRLSWALVALVLLLILVTLFGSKPATPASPFNGMISFGRHDDALGDTVPYVINPDGTHERRLRDEVHEATFWSPNGNQIGFTDGVINADGTGFRSFDDAFDPLFVPCWAWSPDGNLCLAEGWDDSNPGRNGLYLLIASARTRPVQLTHHRDVAGRFSRDGSMVAFNRDGDLWIIRTEGAGERQVADLNLEAGSWLSFSPDDKAILAASDGVLYRIDVATGAKTSIGIAGERNAKIWDGLYSPDGTRILIRRPQVNGADLYTMRTDGTDLVRLTTTPTDERFVDWGTHPLDK